MLEGSKVKLKQKAMEMIVECAVVLGAEELCEITKAHLFCGAHHYLNALKSDDIDVGHGERDWVKVDGNNGFIEVWPQN